MSLASPRACPFGGACHTCPVHVQTKLAVNRPGDAYEQEADQMAELVTGRTDTPVLQRKCARCHDDDDEEQLQRKEMPGRAGTSDLRPGALDLVHEVLQSPGQALDTGTRSFMEARFGQDFGRVRIHTDSRATESARSVNALAYTVGSNIVFTHQQYQPASLNGQKLLAHELTHVVQQGGIPHQAPLDRLTLDSQDSALERNARHVGTRILAGGARAAGIPSGKAHSVASAPIVSRADPDAVGYTMRMGLSARTGLQFFPTNVTDTQVGPVSVQGGLLSGGASRLNVIIGENMTLRTLASHLLPLWTTATPFTPPGAGAPLPLEIITQDELAQGLLVYNQTYLPVPAMTNWRAGLRLPLPVEVDEGTGIATLHPLQIRALAGGFNAAWAPLLDTAATANAAVAAATLTADVTAFLGHEPTALARGIHLGARALTNAVAELPFIREAFRQLGLASFDVALAFMDNLVNREISLLAAQRNGAAILDEIRNALAATPAAPTAGRR